MQAVNKQAIAHAFGRAAQRYNQHAQLQRFCGETLAGFSRRQQGLKVLDAGCGPGWFSQRWRRAGNHVTALDLSTEMIEQAQASGTADRYQHGDIEALPFAEPQFDLCWSNLAVQWCSDLRLALAELYRVTLPGGQVLFSTLSDGSLHQLAEAWKSLDVAAPLNRFLPINDIQQAGKSLPLVLTQQTLTLGFPDVLSALLSLKGIGATHLHQGRQGRPLSRRHLQQLAYSWPQDQRGYLLSYHLVYGVIHGE